MSLLGVQSFCLFRHDGLIYLQISNSAITGRSKEISIFCIISFFSLRRVFGFIDGMEVFSVYHFL